MNPEQAAQLNPKEHCRDCHKFATWEECVECLKPICGECQVRCAACGAGKDYRCVSCALRCGFEKVAAGQWRCENDIEDFAPPIPIHVEEQENIA